MSILRRLSFYSGQRVDIPHIRALESAVSHDFDMLLRGLFTGLNQPYIIRGFEIDIPTAAINATSLVIKVADSAVLHSSAAESGTILLVSPTANDEILNSSNSKVLGAFQNGTVNYVSLSYKRKTDSATLDQTAGWSQAQKTEFQRTVPIGRILDYEFVISTAGFGSNLPLYIVSTTSSGAVEYITKATPNLFRLGRGGTVPDPQYIFTYKNLGNTQGTNPRREWINENTTLTPNPVTVVPGDSKQAFNYGDFAISNFKDWADAIMSRFRELTGSAYWYTDSSLLTSSPKLIDVWWDSLGSVLTGSGYMAYNLVLESTSPTYGAFQSSLTDNSILASDSYVYGVNSGNTAILSSFNFSQLIINSLLRDDFIFDETLWNRRLFRPSYTNFSLDDATESSDRVAVLKRLPLLSGTYSAVSSWSYTARLPRGADVTVNFSSPHSFNVGDYIDVRDLNCASNQPDSVYMVKSIPSATSLLFSVPVTPTGSTTTTVLSGVRLDSPVLHPYVSSYSIASWSYSGTAITITPENTNHPFVTGDVLVIVGLNCTNAPNGRFTVTVNADRSISYTALSSPSGVASLLSTSFLQPDESSFILTVNGASPETYDVIDVEAVAYDRAGFSYIVDTATSPTLAEASGAIEFDGVVAIAQVANPVKINSIEYGTDPVAVTGNVTINVDTITNISPNTNYLVPGMSVAGAGIAAGTKILTILSSTSVKLTSQALNSYTGTSFQFTSPYIEITTASDHGYSTVAGPISFTIYGDISDSSYIRTYENISILNISPTVFRLVGSSIFDAGTYTNSGSDDTFARSPSNPYAGPFQWTSDLIIKGVIGDKYFKIPQTAISSGTSLANKFNINGLTGTAYLQDGEVAYIELIRNRLASTGATYTTSGGASSLTGSAPLQDEDGNMLQIGDWVKFEEEDESKWFRISNAGFVGLQDGDSLPSGTTTVFLRTDKSISPSLQQRPPKAGKIVYTKTIYNQITVKPHTEVASSPDIYWLAMRRDNNSAKSKLYLKALELELGEQRQINDNEPSNLLTYTGASSEASINPNYSVIDKTGSYQYTEDVEIASSAQNIDIRTRSISFVSGPTLLFQAGDRLVKTVGSSNYIFTIEQVLTSNTVVVQEDVSPLFPSDSLKYYRVNYKISDSDNLTLASRKHNRELATINTALTRPIYDESIYLQQITLSANSLAPTASVDSTDPLNADQIISGEYVYLGSANSPSALAWVIHGTKAMTETIENSSIGMPGGSFGSTKILVHVISGTFPHNATLKQFGRSGISRQVVNPSGDPFPSPSISASSAVEMVLPPNRRTQIVGSEYIVWPSMAQYKASQDSALAGEELMVIINDAVRQANVDYSEIYGGPKGRIRIDRDLPENSRLRFRILPSYGSAILKVAGSVTLQIAYDGGNIVNLLPGRPLDLSVPDRSVAIAIAGGIEIDSVLSGNVVGGIMPKNDKSFNIGSEAKKPKETWTAKSNIKSHDAYSGSGDVTFTAAHTTVGSSAHIITDSTITVSEGSAVRVKLKAIARRSDGILQGSAGFEVHGTFYRETGSSLQIAGSPQNLITGCYGDGFEYAITFGIVGNDIVAVCYGNGVVEWACTIEYQAVALPT